METFSALLALCEGNPPVTGGFPSQRPVTRSFDVFIDLRLGKRLSKQSWHRWFKTPSRSLWRHCNEWHIFLVLSILNITILQSAFCHPVCLHTVYQTTMSVIMINEPRRQIPHLLTASCMYTGAYQLWLLKICHKQQANSAQSQFISRENGNQSLLSKFPVKVQCFYICMLNKNYKLYRRNVLDRFILRLSFSWSELLLSSIINCFLYL